MDKEKVIDLLCERARKISKEVEEQQRLGQYTYGMEQYRRYGSGYN